MTATRLAPGRAVEAVGRVEFISQVNDRDAFAGGRVEFISAVNEGD
jgi:hypothetical protein